MSGNRPTTDPVWTLTGLRSAATRGRLRALLAIFVAAVCVALPARAQQEVVFGSEPDPEPRRVADPPPGGDLRPDDSDDDPDSEAELEKSAAERVADDHDPAALLAGHLLRAGDHHAAVLARPKRTAHGIR